MGLLRQTFVILGASLLLYGGLRAWMWTRVRTRRLRPPRIRGADVQELPLLLRPVFEAAERELAALGFVPAGARWIESIDVCEGPRPERVYRHPSGTLAFVGPPLPHAGERPYRMTFVSRLREGPVVATFDGRNGVTGGFPPGWRCTDHGEPEPARQWALHLRSLEAAGGVGAVADTPLEAWNRLERRALADTLRDWEARGRTRRTGDAGGRRPRWRFRPFAAWRLGCRMLRGQRSAFAREADAARHRAHQELWRSNSETGSEDPTRSRTAARAAAMAWGYRYERAARSCRAARRNARRKIAASLAAAGACLAGLGAWMGWPVAAAVGGVLALHELGHVAGTAWLARPARLAVPPTPGGRAADGATPGRRAAIALLGPAPGLLLGLAASYVFARGGDGGWLLLAVVALTVNYFNLLPILPLDGGRVVEALLLDRYPRAQVVFLAAGAAGAGLAAWVFRDLVLAALALAFVLSLKVARAAAGALVRARATIRPHMTESDRVLAVFETLQEPPYAGLPVARRRRIADVIVPRLAGRPASRRAVLAGAAVYVALLVGVPAALSAGLLLHRPAEWGGVAEESEAADAGEATAIADGAAEAAGGVPVRYEPVAAPDPASASRISETSLVGR